MKKSKNSRESSAYETKNMAKPMECARVDDHHNTTQGRHGTAQICRRKNKRRRHRIHLLRSALAACVSPPM